MAVKRGRVRWELNKDGVARLLRAPGVEADLQRRADRIAAAAGPGVETSTWQGHDRVRSRVYTATKEADYRQATTRSLSRAIDAGRG